MEFCFDPVFRFVLSITTASTAIVAMLMEQARKPSFTSKLYVVLRFIYFVSIPTLSAIAYGNLYCRYIKIEIATLNNNNLFIFTQESPSKIPNSHCTRYFLNQTCKLTGTMLLPKWLMYHELDLLSVRTQLRVRMGSHVRRDAIKTNAGLMTINI